MSVDINDINNQTANMLNKLPIPIRTHLFRALAGKDNHTLDMGRILWFLGAIVFFALSGFAIFKGQAFDPVAWGTGFGAVLAGGGAALGMKARSEPEATTTTEVTVSANVTTQSANT